ncbi:MAG: glycosyltransferase family 2 protein [Proteobacteria bacterium]|nr:glycosyltransferase family 2 protein [Pseudomonadota bacterium]
MSSNTAPEFSVIVPCYDEEDAIEETVENLVASIGEGFEIIVVDDGSTDWTAEILKSLDASFHQLRVVTHERNRGYGAALKSGIRRAHAELIVITDADGTYPNERVPELVKACEGKDMVVGARVGGGVEYSKVRALPKIFLTAWASWIAGMRIPDINSGMRVFRKDVAETFFGILPDSFSFTMTITLAMLTTFRQVEFIPISYKRRIGKSKIKPIRDTIRFITIILRTGVYFAPLRVFLPFALLLSLLAIASLIYDIAVLSDLTDKTVILILFSFNTGMFALLADMLDKRVTR